MMTEEEIYQIYEAQESKKPIQKKSALELWAKIFSTIFTPLLIPTYGAFIALNFTFLGIVTSLSTRVIVVLAIFAFTCMVPISVIALLYRYGKISDPGVNNQKDRLIPYAITVLSYLASAIYLSNVNAPKWIPMFMIGGGIAALVSALINLKWKISAHGAAMGGLVALMFAIWANGYATFNYMYITCIAIILTGIVGTSRLILNCHTLGQVLAGTLNGFFWVFILTI